MYTAYILKPHVSTRNGKFVVSMVPRKMPVKCTTLKDFINVNTGVKGRVSPVYRHYQEQWWYDWMSVVGGANLHIKNLFKLKLFALLDADVFNLQRSYKGDMQMILKCRRRVEKNKMDRV